MLNNKSVSILGCGWLGSALAKTLLTDNEDVKGSTTSPEKIPLLAGLGIDPYLVQFSDGKQPPNLREFLTSDILIIAVSPGRTPEKQRDYSFMLSCLTRTLPESSIAKVIFISSTAVYGDANKEFTEADDPQTDNGAGQRILQAEQIICGTGPVQVVVLRLAGLVGPERHPGRFFAGKKDIPNGLAPVNMVHQEDVIGVVKAIILDEGSAGVYNVCAPYHPAREQFYTLAAERSGLEAPQFIREKKKWKLIGSSRIGSELKYSFKVPDLLKWLKT